MTIDEFKLSLLFMGFKQDKSSASRYKTKEFIVFIDKENYNHLHMNYWEARNSKVIWLPKIFVYKNYMPTKSKYRNDPNFKNKQYTKPERAIRYIIKSYEHDKPLFGNLDV